MLQCCERSAVSAVLKAVGAAQWHCKAAALLLLPFLLPDLLLLLLLLSLLLIA